ncbi:hypothetical protein COEREDRAFT_10434 [Coemansia reversa NRRL 1564]|uniref:Uncharacterized protein n=1 Tax=Coemansia reversa (strain ATCC 12441 / NRRL 1564) TaxID=763665 RepID=A0A2G5B5V4_COERN|nr:hypothetical protein COEREDRAFT_10434 [Coemansia reversa NRRL 1564]|eukprot:PIA14389.1 hypothetical protein COEREDRAFT_10434 [Coemansia reversa NRRL 1564]
MRTGAKPLLKPLWSDSAPHRALGRTRVNLRIKGGPAIWTDAVVIRFRTSWEVLIGDKALEGLGIRLMTPAIQKRLKTGRKQPDHPAKTLDTDWRKEQLRVPSEEEYEKLPESASTHDPEILSLSDPTPAAIAVPEPVVSRPMRARLGLPADFFIPQRDAEFECQNALYPEASEASIKERLHHQCPDPALARRLLSEIVMGKGAVREYPGGCPPPAAYAPIKPPMHAEAKPVYVVQHTLSDAAREARDKVVSERVQYGIDEPSRAFAQMPIFTKSKPNTDE